MSEQENKPNNQLPHDNFERDQRTDLDDKTNDKPRGMALHTKVLIGLVVGAVGGVAAHQFVADKDSLNWFINNFTQPVGQLFLNLLLMIVVPMVFSSLIVGVAGIGDVRKLGRVGLKSFGYCLIISAISVLIGLGVANVVQPGKMISEETATKMKAQFGTAAGKQVDDQKKAQEAAAADSALMSVVKTIVPKNLFFSIGGGENPNMLHVMFFALIFGIAITLIPEGRGQSFVDVMDSIFQICAKVIDIIMMLAPYAVACLIFTNMARFGIELLGALGGFVLAVLFALSLHMFGVYSLSVYFLSGLNPIDFFRRVWTVIVTAFSTSSSNATLPTALRVSEENLGVPREINSFVLTVGATANQNGTALYEGITVLFIAQLAGFELTMVQQLAVLYLAILGGVGTAGVPAASIPFIIGILASLGIDPSLIAIILGVDRLLDMCRTTLNVVGDITAATFVARSEGYELLRTHPIKVN